jgi:hypothetical protein
MKRLLPCLALIALPAAAQDRPDDPGGRRAGGSSTPRSYANPSAIVAAELALARDAGARGQWTALGATAAPDAVVFAPQLIWAREWLKGRTNPAQAERWQPHAVWSSCDGSLVASSGSWRLPDGDTGFFRRLWQRQGDGSYKWIAAIDRKASLPEPEPEMIRAAVADCPVRAARGLVDAGQARSKPPRPRRPLKFRELPPLDPSHRAGAAEDGTLIWDAEVAADGTQRLTVRWRKDGAEQVLISESARPAG